MVLKYHRNTKQNYNVRIIMVKLSVKLYYATKSIVRLKFHMSKPLTSYVRLDLQIEEKYNSLR